MLSKASTFVRQTAQTQLRSMMIAQNARGFSAPTQELVENLKKLGIRNKNIVHNPT